MTVRVDCLWSFCQVRNGIGSLLKWRSEIGSWAIQNECVVECEGHGEVLCLGLSSSGVSVVKKNDSEQAINQNIFGLSLVFHLFTTSVFVCLSSCIGSDRLGLG